MENRFNNRDFEQFVKQNADQYRMFPSEKVWDNIHSTLHVRKRWYGVGVILLFITVATFTLIMVNHPDKNQAIAQSIPEAKQSKTSGTQNDKESVFIAPASTSVKKPSDVVSAGKHHPSMFVTDPAVPADETIAEDISLDNTGIASVSVPVAPVAQTSETEKITSAAVIADQRNRPVASLIAHKEMPQQIAKTVMSNLPVADETTEHEKTTDADKKDKGADISLNLLRNENKPESDIVKINRKNKKLALQAYVTPLISYRDLKENKAFIRAVQTGNITPQAYVPVPDVKNIVTHKPDMGIQLGVTGNYPLSKTFSIVGGIQLTVSKYDIKAYAHTSEVATIALSSAAGGTNTISTYTNYRNIGGYKEDWLRNLYVSAAIPIGLEVRVASNRKGYVGATGTVQPTYVIDNRSYLLSTDFKNYAEMPSLIRKVNLNTGFEVFVANTTGKVHWRVGPQVRYQVMSSFKKKYPVEEHLFDFGLKLGILLR
ncbi:MAG: hypothetical protein NTW29_16310 [Bacteroidetes bacterium]|nr:hypothetical protein [Bacteroidota bacterium]